MGRTIDQAGESRSATVESLRALAALGVLEGHVFGSSRGYGAAAHANYLDRFLLGGGFGVFLFFALTGYLLYRPFARRDFAQGDQVVFSRYAANRAFRILPLYYTVLIIYLTVIDRGSVSTWLRSVFFLQNFYPQTLSHVDGVMWSLVVEVQFYVLLPFLALLLARVSAGSPWICGGLLLAVGGLSEMVRLVTVTMRNAADIRWEYSLPSTFVFFVTGMLLALLETQLAAGARSRRLANSRSTAWFLASLPFWLVVMWNYNLDILVVPATFLMLGSMVLPLRRGQIHRFMEWKPLAALGVASYSLYLWHFPLVSHIAASSWAPHGYWALMAICVPVSIAVAALSYRLVEAPFLRLRRSWSATSPAPGRRTMADVGRT